MPHSFSQTADLDCPRCGTHFRAELWLIVDAAERPDLLEKARQGHLHEVTCPNCGPLGQADAPLLLYFPLGEGPGVRVLFSPAQSTTADQDQEHARALLARLKASLGPAWQDEWLAQGLPTVPRSLLPLALTEGLQAAQKALASQTEAPPEAIRILEEAGELGKNLVAVLSVRSAEEHRAFLEQHPELYGEEGIALLQRLLSIETRPQAKQQLEMFLQIHRRCREDGLENTFAQIIEASQLPPERRKRVERAAQSQTASPLAGRFQELLDLQSKAENNPALWPQALQGWQDLITRAEREGETLLAASARGNLANACVSLYEVSGNASWADRAERILNQIGQTFSRQQAPQA